MIRPRVGPLLALAVLAAVFACDLTEPVLPEPGDLAVRLTTPHGTEGAVLVRITGPGLSTVEPARPAHEVHVRTVDATLTVAVFGTIGAGELLRFAVPNIREAERYAVSLVEVADPENELRASLTGYSATVVAP
jgi:hypothetical protein